MSFLSAYLRWDIIAMFVAIAILTTFELLGVFGSHYVTLTAIIHRYIPKWIIAMVWGWLGYHFIWRY